MTENTIPTQAPDAIENLAEAVAALPEYARKFRRIQGEASIRKSEDGRLFNIGGPKGDAVAAYLIAGGYTRQEIADYVGCSVSRVAEVAWGLDAAGVEYNVIKRRPKAQDVAAAE